MSGDAADFPKMVSAAATVNTAPLKKRRGWGCFGSVGGVILLALAVYVALIPRALHIFGR